MEEQDFPALYRSADALAVQQQRLFLVSLGTHLALLVIAAAISVFYVANSGMAYTQAACLLITVFLSVFIGYHKPDRIWYNARAVAESVKTLTWRYMMCAEPFQAQTDSALQDFQRKLRAVLDQNQQALGLLSANLADRQVTDTIRSHRDASFTARRNIYIRARIEDQRNWYATKASFNRKRARAFFVALVLSNLIAFALSLLRVASPSIQFFPVDIFIALSASLLTWIQGKRFSELAASYALAAHEIGIIREQANAVSEAQFSTFVADTENAFSREHTQWVARKDA